MSRLVEQSPENLHINPYTNKQVAYTLEARQFLKEHPGVIKTIKNLITEVDLSLSAHPVGTQGQIKVEPLRKKIRPLYRITIEGQEFFLKKVSTTNEGGYKEITAAHRAKLLLRDLEWVDVVDYQFGYSNNLSGESVIVSRLFDKAQFIKVDVFKHNYARALEKTAGREIDQLSEEVDMLESRINIIKQRLVGFADLNDYNMAYNPSTQKILLFDLNQL